MWQGTYPILDFLTHGTVERIQTWSPEDWGQVPSLPQRATGPWANPLPKQMGQRQGPLAMWCSILWLLFFGAGGWAELMIWISHNCWTKQTWGPKPCAKPVGGRCQPQGRNEEQGGWGTHMDKWLMKKRREATYEGCQIYPSKPPHRNNKGVVVMWCPSPPTRPLLEWEHLLTDVECGDDGSLTAL